MKVTTVLVNQVLTDVQLSKEESFVEFRKVAEINGLSMDCVFDNYNKFIGDITRSIIEIIEEIPKRAKQVLK